MRDISRWMKTFKIKLASEKNTRLPTKDCVGKGLCAEMAPLTKAKRLLENTLL